MNERFQNVRIVFPDGLDGYMRALSVNARANISKARNRLRRDGKNVSFSFRSSVGIGDGLDGREVRAQMRRCRSVYVERQESRYRNRGLLARLYFLHGSYVALSVKQAGVLARDMKKVDQYVVFQMIGRDAGWLAAASAVLLRFAVSQFTMRFT